MDLQLHLHKYGMQFLIETIKTIYVVCAISYLLYYRVYRICPPAYRLIIHSIPPVAPFTNMV